MALFDIEFPDDFMSELLDSEFGDIAEEALSATAPILEASMKQACRRVIEHEGDSELVESFTCSKPKQTKTDAWIVNVYPKGTSKTKTYTAKYRGRKTSRKYSVSNALKCIWKEYGIQGRQPARPFISSACHSVESTVMNKIQEIYEKKVGMK